MPRLDDPSFVLHDYPPNFVEFARAEASIPDQNDGLKPEFGFIPVPSHVYVPGFGTIETVKEEPKWPRNIGDSRHVEIRTNRLIVAVPEQSLPDARNSVAARSQQCGWPME